MHVATQTWNEVRKTDPTIQHGMSYPTQTSQLAQHLAMEFYETALDYIEPVYLQLWSTGSLMSLLTHFSECYLVGGDVLRHFINVS